MKKLIIAFLLIALVFVISCTPRANSNYPPVQNPSQYVGGGCAVSHVTDYVDLGEVNNEVNQLKQNVL